MEDTPETTPESVPAEKEKASTPVATVTQNVEPSFDPAFLESLRKYFPIETLRESVRVTPKGLFVLHTFREQIVESYQKWLESLGLPTAARTTGKIRRRLFGGENPPLFYLAEGKNVIAGFLAVATVQQPQRYQLPHYLGSLTDSRTVLSSHDPLLEKIEGVTVAQGAKGVEISVKIGNETLLITNEGLKEFLSRAEHSPRTMKEFPELKNSQAELLIALVTLLRKSRLVALDKDPRLLPKQFVEQKRLTMRAVGSYEFIFSQDRRLVAVLDLKGKNLAHFVWREMSALRQKGERRIGIFDLASERERHIGTFNIRGEKIRLTAHALAGFVEHIGDSPEKRDRFLKNYSVRDCFEKFSILFQTAQPIDGRLIQTFVSDFKQRGTRFTVNGAWIFVLSPDRMVTHCLARHARPRDKSRGNTKR